MKLPLLLLLLIAPCLAKAQGGEVPLYRNADVSHESARPQTPERQVVTQEYHAPAPVAAPRLPVTEQVRPAERYTTSNDRIDTRQYIADNSRLPTGRIDPEGRNVQDQPRVRMQGAQPTDRTYVMTSRNNYVAPARAASNQPRYNPADRRSYMYCGTPYTWMRCHNRSKDSICRNDYLQPIYSYNYSDCNFFVLTCLDNVCYYTCAAPYREDLSVIKTFSYDGYIVYYGDTITGIVTVLDKDVVVESTNPADRNKSYKANLKDMYLHDVVLFGQLRELHMVRVSPRDSRLSRELHKGKLSLYDDRFSFFQPGNIHKINLFALYEGRTIRIDNKQQLMALINTAYQQHFTKDYSWKELLAILSGFD